MHGINEPDTGAYLPSEEEIAKRCKEIRLRWSVCQEHSRRANDYEQEREMEIPVVARSEVSR